MEVNPTPLVDVIGRDCPGSCRRTTPTKHVIITWHTQLNLQYDICRLLVLLTCHGANLLLRKFSILMEKGRITWKLYSEMILAFYTVNVMHNIIYALTHPLLCYICIITTHNGYDSGRSSRKWFWNGTEQSKKQKMPYFEMEKDWV